MATGKITISTVNALAPDARQKRFLWDTQLRGFGVYVSPAGRKVYVVQYRMPRTGGNARRFTIGPHGPWTPDKARNRAAELLLQTYNGIDPLAEAEAHRKAAEVDERVRFTAFAEAFLEAEVYGKLRSEKDIRDGYTNDLIPYFGDKPLTAITAADIYALLDLCAAEYRGKAVRAYKLLSRLFNYAAERGVVEHSPIRHVKKPKGYDPRQRHLKDWEILRVWEAAHDQGYPGGRLTHMLLLTGQRVNEVAGLSWEEIDLEARTWFLPASRAKNNRDHILPLTGRMIDYLDEHWPAESRTGLLFPAGRGAEGHVSGFASFRSRLRKFVERRLQLAIENGQDPARKQVTHFHLHDLRRTVSSTMRRLKISQEHTDAVLNHVRRRTKLIETYHVYDFHEEKLAAMETWHGHLKALLEGPDAWPGGRDLSKLRISNPKRANSAR